MAQIAAIDIQVVAAIGLGLLLIGCVLVLFYVRDTRWSPQRTVRRAVRCPTHQRLATVDFNERVVTGMSVRNVERCSLIDEGERCHQDCRDEIALESTGAR